MSIRAAYDDWSATYDDDPNVTRELDAQITAQTLGRFSGGRVLELGCGTGKNTKFLAERFDHVIAVDFSAGMLARARAHVASNNVEFVEADFTAEWPCPPQCVELVTLNLVLEHVADLTGVYQNAARSLCAGGHVFVCELHPFRQYLGSQARFERQGETKRIEAFPHHVSDYLSAAEGAKLALVELREWWHPDYGEQVPRLISFLFHAAD
jgi:malonyl-CoA O-methyltransferase